jgi:hypothetical protein
MFKHLYISATYDQTGAADYSSVVQAAEAAYEKLIVSAGIALLNTYCILSKD